MELKNQEDIENLVGRTDIKGDVLIGSEICNKQSPITSLSSMSSVRNITGKLKVSCLPMLASLDGFDNVVHLGGLEIDSNVALKRIEAFNKLTQLSGSLVVTNNVNLVTIAGFNALTEVRDYVQIDRNWNLTSLTGLKQLGQITGKSLSGGYFALSVANNFRLESLEGFRSLKTVSEGTVHIEGNRRLCFAGYPIWNYGEYKLRPQNALDKGIDWRTILFTNQTRLWKWTSGSIPTLLIQHNGDLGECESSNCAEGCKPEYGCLGPQETGLCGTCQANQNVIPCSLGPPETSETKSNSNDLWPPTTPYLILYIIIVLVVAVLVVLTVVFLCRFCKQRAAKRRGSFRLKYVASTDNIVSDAEAALDDDGISMHAMRRIESPVNEQPNAYAGLLSTMPEQPSTSGHEDIVSEKELEKREKEERKLQLKQQKEREKQEKERLKREKEEQKALEKQMRKQRSDAGLDSSLVIENANRMDDMLLEQKSKVAPSVASHVHVHYSREQLKLEEEIGKGVNFEVFIATAQRIVSGLKKTKVVVKKLKNPATDAEKQQFLKDIQHIKTLEQHENLLSMLGLCTDVDPFIAILEYCTQGNLKTYLIRHRWDAAAVRERGAHIRMAIDIASGLEYLHQHDHIHNDIAARNCQVAVDSSIKIGDYGLAQEIFRDDYHLIESFNKIVPIRWLAPEILTVDDTTVSLITVQTMASNVWSFGVTLWEVMSFAQKPYEKLSNEEVLHSVIQNKTTQLENPLEPGQRPQESFVVMQSCWLLPENRPTMSHILEVLEHLRTTGELLDTFCEQFDSGKKLRSAGCDTPLPPSEEFVKQSPPPLTSPSKELDPPSPDSPTIVPQAVKLAAAMDVTQPSPNSPVIRGSPPITDAAAAKRTAILEALASQENEQSEQVTASAITTINVLDDELQPRRSSLRPQSADKLGPKKTVQFHETNLTQTIDVSIVSLHSLENSDEDVDDEETDEDDGLGISNDDQIYRSDTLTRKRKKDKEQRTVTGNLLATDLDTVSQVKGEVSSNEDSLPDQAASGESSEDKAALIW